MRRRRRLPVLLFAAAVPWALIAERPQWRADRPWTFLVADVSTGWAMVAAGLFVWLRRPSNRCWTLLLLAGVCWSIGSLQRSTNLDVATLGFAFDRWYQCFLVWALLAYPTGRLRLRRDLALLVTEFVLVSVRSLSRLFLYVPPDVAGHGTRNRFLPITDKRWWLTVDDVSSWMFAATIAAVLATVAHHWLTSGRPGRRMLTPALVASSIFAATVIDEYLIGWNANIPGTDVPVYYAAYMAQAVVALSLAYGLVRLRKARSAVVDLVTALGEDEPPERLGDALGLALGDPTLELLAWNATAFAYVDDAGQPVEVALTAPPRAVTFVQRHGQPVAALIHDYALLEDPGLVNAVVAAVRVEAENARLRAEIESQLAEVEASRARIIAAADAERRRIERDLHDGAQQRLVTIALALRLAQTRTDGPDGESSRDVLAQAVKDLAAAIDELRDLARGIHPAILSESGLRAAIESLADRFPLPVRLHLDIPSDLPGDTATAAYFSVAEALTNVAKHAGATEAVINAAPVDDKIVLTVSDDGDGGADAHHGTGLRGIADRVAAAGGTIHIHSPRGAGTKVEVILPCASS